MSRQTDPDKAIIAVVDDDEATRVSIGQMLRLRGYRVELFASAESALTWPALSEADCVISDIKMPGMDGEAFLAEIRRRGLRNPALMVTGHGDVAMAVRCLKNGAYDFIEKPFDDDVLLAGVGRAVEKTALSREAEDLRRKVGAISDQENGRFGMVGVSKAMRDVYDQIEVAARSRAPVLISGETGVGKELVARAIHDQSPRAGKAFVPVNAGALAGSVLESELFGHKRGAFTGADSDRDGRLVTASGGTLLLDEVESLSVKAQVQLLRVLEDGLVYPVGRDIPIEVDVRILATTKEDLEDKVRSGEMRKDFYHRIMVLNIQTPPLRERSEDIPLLVAHFLRCSAERNGVQVPHLTETELGELLRYNWPGNVRELKNSIERMVITARDGAAGAFIQEGGDDSARLLSLPPGTGRLRSELERTEGTVIASALRENNGEVSSTALSLGISRRALYERMKKYGLSRDDYRE
ncbi:MAG TPA: sigma-54 dependent transcriptional regulator [Candidatus Brocadiia bacterium]|nr:sigma-54 dependent transcriptional regulator [Candidatus Brocadiia bacterium]